MDSDIEIDGLATLSHEGRSRHWSGLISVDGAPEPIELTFDSTPEGPAPVQVQAVRDTLGQWGAVLSEAEPGLTNLLEEASLAVPASAWDAFRITGISVAALDYDPDGSVHTFINLVHVDHPDEFWPAIDVVNGIVVDVLSGT